MVFFGEGIIEPERGLPKVAADIRQAARLPGAPPQASRTIRDPDENDDGDFPVHAGAAVVVTGKTPALDAMGRDITGLARANALEPVIGRADIIDEVVAILSTKKKPNALLVGEAGVGKTAIVEGLAKRIVSGNVPPALKRARVVEIEAARVIAGAKYRGEAEARWQRLIDEAEGAGNVILFVDELHMVTKNAGEFIPADALKPTLGRGRIRVIGATTLDEHRRYIAGDPAFERRFQLVRVGATTVEETQAVLRSIAKTLSVHHGVRIPEEQGVLAMKLAKRFRPEKALPDSAIDILDRAGAIAAANGAKVVGKYQLHQATAQLSGIPVERIAHDRSKNLLQLSSRLKRVVIGQDEAIDTVADALLRSAGKVGNPNRPILSALLIGRSGMGKTFLAKRLAYELFGSEDELIRLDMSDYKDKYNAARLIGAPPGYIGYGDHGSLVEQIRRKPYCVLLLDEIEEAHPDIHSHLLQVLEEAELTDGESRKARFNNVVILMTSNLGHEDSSTGELGFSRRADGTEATARGVRRGFTEKFANRVDEVITFRDLSRDEFIKVLEREVLLVTARAQEEFNCRVRLTNRAREELLRLAETNAQGARGMRKVVERHVGTPLGRFTVEQTADSLHHALIHVDFKEGRTFAKFATTQRNRKESAK